jgi:hypothetical protein
MHAGQISVQEFWRFAWNQRRELLRFLRWADRMHSEHS